MPTSIFQLFKKEFPEPLSDTINIFQSRCISYTKHILNIAIVIPFHKNGDKIVITTELFLSYLVSAKCLKNLCTFVK